MAKAISRDQGDVNGLLASADSPKRLSSSYYPVQFLFIQNILSVSVLHFTEIDNSIPTIKTQVNLDVRHALRGSPLPPSVHFHGDAGYAKLRLYLANVFKTKTFKCKPPPCIFSPLRHRRPIIVNVVAMRRRKLHMKQAEPPRGYSPLVILAHMLAHPSGRLTAMSPPNLRFCGKLEELEGQAPRKAHFSRVLRFSPPAALMTALPAAWRSTSRRGW